MNPKDLIEAYVDDVVRLIGRKQRNDVGFELRALLNEELETQVEIAGRPADEEMALALLRRFGRPADVAARYGKPGFPIIEPADGPAFVRLTAIGMGLIWAVSLVATFSEPGGPGGTDRLGRWWMSGGLGAFWWPGFLVVCMGAGAWVRRRFPLADEWKPRAIDRDRINRVAWVFASALCTLGTIWLISPGPIIEQVSGGRLAPQFYAYFVYDDSFRQTRLPLLISLLAAHIVLYVVLVAEGRWRKLTRRIDIGISMVICAVLLWMQAGPILENADANRGARVSILIIVLFVVFDIGSKLLREQARVRTPKSLRR